MRTIILSAAHGVEVSGKRSPDGRFREYLWSRRACRLIQSGLHEMGVACILIPEGDSEPGLWKRVEIENQIKGPAFVFPLHNNAAGNGKKWMSARGAEIWTSKGETQSDYFATMIMDALKKEFPEIENWRSDFWSDGDVDKECNFIELMSIHPAALLEWLFQDNKEDVMFLEDEDNLKRFCGCMISILYKISLI